MPENTAESSTLTVTRTFADGGQQIWPCPGGDTEQNMRRRLKAVRTKKCILCASREQRIAELHQEIERLQGLVDECELISRADAAVQMRDGVR